MTTTHCSFHEYSISCAAKHEIDAVSAALSATWESSKSIARRAGVTTQRATTILSLLVETSAVERKRDPVARWQRQVYRKADGGLGDA